MYMLRFCLERYTRCYVYHHPLKESRAKSAECGY